MWLCNSTVKTIHCLSTASSPPVSYICYGRHSSCELLTLQVFKISVGPRPCLILHLFTSCFSSTYTKTGTIQRRLAWPLCKDDMQIHEVFHIKKKKKDQKSCWKFLYCECLPAGNIPVQTLVPWAISIHLALSLRVIIYQSCHMSTVYRQSNQVATVLDLITIFH